MTQKLSLRERMLLSKLPKKDKEDKDFMNKLLRVRELFQGRFIEIKKIKE